MFSGLGFCCCAGPAPAPPPCPPPHTHTHPTRAARCIKLDHLGILALPVAEFLALSHKTSYLGYSLHTSSQAHHEFFANRCGPGQVGGWAGGWGPVFFFRFGALNYLLLSGIKVDILKC